MNSSNPTRQRGLPFALVLSLLALAQGAQAQSLWQWARADQGGDNEFIRDIAVDTVNNAVYAVGGYDNSGILGIGASGLDGFVTKTDLNGNIQWTQRIGSSGVDAALGVAVGSNGNIYVTGYYSPSAFLTFPAVVPTTTAGGTDMYLACLTPAGGVNWVRTGGGGDNDLGIAVGVNASGVFVQGQFYSSATFSGNATSTQFNSGSKYRSMLLKYSSAGSYLWQLNGGCGAGGNKDVTAERLAVDEAGVYVTGSFETNQMRWYNPANNALLQTINATQPDLNIYVCAVSNAGAFTWGKAVSNPGSDNVEGNGIAVGCSGVYITGSVHNNSEFPGGVAVNVAGNPHDHMYLASLDRTTGNTLWVRTAKGSENHKTVGYDVAVHRNGCVLMTGTFKGTATFTDGTAASTTGGGGYELDGFIARFTPNGQQDWATVVEGDKDNVPMAIAMDQSGGIYVGGQYEDKLLMPPYSFDSNADFNYFWGKTTDSSLSYWPLNPTNWRVPSVVCTTGPALNLNTLLLPYTQGYADAVTASNGVASPNNILNAPNNTNVVFSTNGWSLTADLTDTIPAGSTYVISWAKNSAVAGLATPTLEASVDGTTWTAVTAAPTITATTNAFVNSVVQANVDTRYLRISKTAASATAFRVEAIKFNSGSQTGGTWSGTGVTGASFNPAGLSGPIPITYTVQNGTCALRSTTKNIVVSVCTAPGGYSTNLRVWYKADAGAYTSTAPLTTCADGQPVTQWKDRTSNALDLGQTTAAQRPIWKDGSASPTFNYNPSLRFGNNFLQRAAPGILSSGTAYDKLNLYAVYQDYDANDFDWLLHSNGNNGFARLSLSMNWAGGPNMDCDVASTSNRVSINTSTFLPINSTNIVSVKSDANGIYGGGEANKVQVFANGAAGPALSAHTSVIEGNFPTQVGDNESGVDSPNNPFTGELAELLLFTGSIDQATHQKIETYLALKYSTKLIGHDYKNSAGTTVYANSGGYTSGVIGIIRDDAQAFLQKQSHQPDDSTRLYLSALAGTNAGNAGYFTADQRSIVMGHNNARMDDQNNSAEKPATICRRIDREWKVTNTAFTGTFSIDLRLAASTWPLSDLRLLIDADGNFSNALVISPGAGFTISSSGGVLTLSGISTALIPANTTRYLTIAAADNTPPVISGCPASVTLNADPGQCSAAYTFTPPTASDNCGLTLQAISTAAVTAVDAVSLPAGEYPLGVTTQTFTFTDVSGNTSTCSFTITVVDNQAPTVVTCPLNISVPAAPGTCGAVVNYTTPVFADNCEFRVDRTGAASGSVFPVGTSLVTHTARDSANRTISCSFQVTVLDQQAPVFTGCPSNKVVQAPLNGTGTTVGWTAPTVADNCGISAFGQSAGPTSGSFFPIGSTTVEYTATDVNAQSSTCVFTVTVISNGAPLITCPLNAHLNTDPTLCGTVHTYAVPTVTDDQPGWVLTQVDGTGSTSGSLFPVGTTLQTWRVTDSDSNRTECTFIVSVVDGELPVFTTCPGDTTLVTSANSCGAAYVYDLPVLTDNCPGHISTISIGLPSGAVFPLGTTLVQYDGRDASINTASCQFQVTVIDNIPPALSGCPADAALYAEPGACGAHHSFSSPVATDNCSVTLVQSAGPVNGSLFPLGTSTVTFRATDGAGLFTECSFDVVVADTTDPVFTYCPDTVVVTADPGACGAIVNYTPPSATDNCSVLVGIPLAQSSGSFFNMGETPVTYTATDGVTTSACTFIVNVLDNQPPAIVDLPDDITISTDPTTCGASVTWTEPTTSDNCPAAVTLANIGPLSNGDLFPVGTTPVTYIASDGTHDIPGTFLVTVEDNELPGITCPPDLTLSMDAGFCGALRAYDPATAVDNCAVDSVWLLSGPLASDTLTVPNSPYYVTWATVDNSGNVNSCLQTIEVIDTDQPDVACPLYDYFEVYLDANCQVAFPDLRDSVTVSDCSATTNIMWPPADTLFTQDMVVQMTMDVEDVFGHHRDNDHLIWIRDITPPAISCPPDTLLLIDPVTCDVDAGGLLALVTASDGCGGPVNIWQSAGEDLSLPLDQNDHPVEFTAEDANGNQATCAFSVHAEDVPPVITGLPDSLTVNMDAGSCDAPMPDLGSLCTITENCSLPLNISQSPSTGDPVPGDTWAYITATDSDPLSATDSVFIHVVDATAPTITCPADTTATADPGSCTANVVFSASATDNCTSSPTMSYSQGPGSDFSVGTHTISVTAVDGSGNSSSCPFTLTVNAAPSPALSYSAASYCGNSGSITPITNTPAGGSFSCATLGAALDPSTGSIDLSQLSGSGSHTITYSIAGTCPQSASAVLQLSIPPDAGDAGSLMICSNGTPSPLFGQLGPDAQAGGSWTDPFAAPFNGTYDPSLNASGIYSYTMGGTTPCANVTANITVTEVAAPNAGTNGTLLVCSNGGNKDLWAHLGGSPAIGGTWSGPNPVAGNIYDPATMVPGVYTYTVSGAAPCANATADVSVTETVAPTAIISYNGSPYCSGPGTASVTHTGTPGGTYSSTAGLVINGSSGEVNRSTSTAGTYTVTYGIPASAGCAAFSTTASITISAAPSATITYSNSPYCSNAGIVNATITGTTGGSFSSTSGLVLNPTTGAVNTATSTPGTYTVTYAIPASAGCAAFGTTASITISAAPSATITYSNSPYCSSSGTANATITGTTGGSFSSTAGLVLNPTSGAVNTATSTVGTYTVTYTIPAGDGCAAFSNTASITISAAPSATITYSNSPYCSNSGIVNATITGTTGGSFSSTSGLVLNPTTGAVNTATSTPGTYTVTYAIPASAGCAAFGTTASITISAAPSATITYSNSPYCSSSGTANATITGTTGGSFSSTAGLVLNPTSGAVNTATSTVGTYTVTYTIPAGDGCAAFSNTASITISAAPSATITYSNSPYCSNSGIVNATITGTTGGSFSSTSGLVLNPTTGAVNTATSTPGTYTVTCAIPASAGCAAFSTTASITINAMPNAGADHSTVLCNSLTSFNLNTMLDGGVATSGTWKKQGNITLTGGIINPSVYSSGTITYWYKLTGTAPCPVDSAIIWITYQDQPVAGSNGVLSICSNGTSAPLFNQLGGTADGGGVWTGPSSVVGGQYDPATMVPGPYIYTLTATVPCVNASATVTVTETTPASAGTDSSFTVCSNDLAQGLLAHLGGFPANGGTWTGPSPVSGNTYAPSMMDPGVYTYTVDSTPPCGPSSASVTVTENAAITYYADQDIDGSGDAAISISTCVPPAGYVLNNTDLCPTDPLKVTPGSCGCGTPDGSCEDCIGVPFGTATPGSLCDDANATTGNDLWDANCLCAGQLIDCEGNAGGPDLPGTACDDGNATTGNDLWDASCICAGQLIDCEGNAGGPDLPGTACDDGNATTGNDLWDASCLCAGQLIDCEGNAGGPALPGTACDDGNATTGNDLWDASCLCAGQLIDCEGNAGGPALPGTACDDSNATTGNDLWDVNCLCAGQLIDCEGNAGGPALPGTACDDSNATTDNDLWDASCICAGQLIDCEGNAGGPDLPGTACDDGNATTGNDLWDASCICAGQLIDCEGNAGGPDLPGTACDDGNATTGNDLWDASCLCAGQLIDCEGNAGGPALPGTACDDGNATTGNDTWGANCLCAGQVIDCMNVPAGAALPGTACDDGNATTGNDLWDASCICAGQLIDCEGNAGGPALPGTACDDGSATTGNDLWDASCICAGQLIDCEGNTGGPALPGTACDDGNATTGNDLWDVNCLCAGQLIDCEGNAGGPALPGTACDDGSATTGNDLWDASCLCAGQLIDCEGNAGGPALPGTACDDGNATTGNDTWGANCLCAGQVIDCMNVPAGAALPGTACDDGNASTGNDLWDASCLCAGQLIDCEGNAGGPALPGTACDDGNATTGNDLWDVNCICAGQLIDCEGNAGGPALPGTACDDSNAATGNDLWDASCLCAGQLIDCEGNAGGPALPGTACDDGNATTGNDTWGANCLCAGQVIDCMNVPAGAALPGTACDDGNASTGNDLWDASCLCAGQLIDCEGNAGGPALPGTACDDGNATTGNDLWDASCLCAGQLIDCEGNAGGPALPGTACDDSQLFTINDELNAACQCVGTAVACVVNGDCNDNDVCTNDACVNNACVYSTITTDTDNDGVADCADNCPLVDGVQGSDCDDGQLFTINDALNAACQCVGTAVACVVNGDCNDNDVCTSDACVNNACVYSTITTDTDNDGVADCADNCPLVDGVQGSDCDDGQVFTINDELNAACQCVGTAVACVVNGDCNDNDVCTNDECVNNACVYSTITTDTDNDGVADCADNCPLVDGVQGSDCDDGQLFTINDELNAACQCVGTAVACVVNGDCNDNDVCTSDACVNNACVYSTITTDTDNDGVADCADNCPLVDGVQGSDCDDGQVFTINDELNAACQCVGTAVACVVNGDCNDNDVCTNDACVNNACVYSTITTDTDNDGVADCADNCPLVDGVQGSDCDDGQVFTINDEINAACQCVGTAVACVVNGDCNDNDVCTNDACVNNACVYSTITTDTDNDGVADCADNCPLVDGVQGSDCDDGQLFTINDALNAACQCVGTAVACVVNGDCNDNDVCTSDACVNNACVYSTITTDTDNDGVADCADNCPLVDGVQGSDCDDGQVFTINDELNAACQCVGTAVACVVNGDCNDNDVCTNDECVNNACVYSTITTDTDNDGVADCADNCPLVDGVQGSDCDDGQLFTINDELNAACQCVGTAVACVVNGDCNDNDVCTSDACVNNACVYSTITTDTDNDGVADCADNCPLVDGVQGSDCDDGQVFTINDELNAACQCVGTAVACVVNGDCNDNDVCTNDACVNNACVYSTITTDTDNDGVADCADNCPLVDGVQGSDCDDGQVFTINDEINAACQCVGTAVACVVNGDCNDNDVCTSDACVNNACVYSTITTDTDNDGVADCADNCPLVDGVQGSDCDDGQLFTINDALNAACQCVGTAVACVVNGDCNDNDVCTSDACVNNACVYSTITTDTDNDGVADCADNCPGTYGQIGSSCDDGNTATGNDIITSNCACAGTLLDCEGVPGGSSVIGTICDDNDPLTINDTWSAGCLCLGIADTDGDSIPDPEDSCIGTFGEIGDPCDDGNTETVDDEIDANCLCSGQWVDCAGVPGGTAGPWTPCDDQDPNTENDIYQVDCTCAGTPIVTCIPPTIISATVVGPVCAGTPLLLSVTATGSVELQYTWSGPGNFYPNAQSASVGVIDALGSLYSVTVTNACGWASADVVVEISPLPDAGSNNSVTVATGTMVNLNLLLSVDSTSGSFSSPTMVAASGNTTYPFIVGIGGNCGMDTAFITVVGLQSGNAGEDAHVHLCAGSSPIDLSAYLNGADQGGTWLNGGNEAVSMPVSIGGDETFTYQVSGDTAVITLDIAPLPDAGTSTSMSICAGDAPANLFSLLGGQPGGTWSGPAAVTNDLFDPATMNSGDYVYTVTDTCGSDADTVTVNITPMADANWNAPGVFCANSGPIDMNSLLTGQAGGAWTGNLSGSIFDPAGQSGSFIFQYTVGSGACASTVSHTITVNPGPMADAGPDGQVCAFNYQLQAVIDVVPGTWSATGDPAPASFTGIHDPSSLVTVPAAGTYPLIWTVGDGQCTASDTVLITFLNPGAPIWVDAGDDQSLDVFTSTQLNGSVSVGASATWSVISGNGIFSDRTDTNATVTNLAVGENILLISAEYGSGCSSSSDTVLITVNDIFIPQGYSPNGDGVNDQFRITGILAFPANTLKVFNRWGQEVIGRKGYANDWDGRSDNGQALPDDTYFYVLNLTPERTYNGFVIIKR